jgi:hypothetical protein
MEAMMSTEQTEASDVAQEAPTAELEQAPAPHLLYAAIHKLRSLPPAKQQEAVDFIEFLSQKYVRPGPHRSLKGLWADQGLDLTEEEIDELRRECWSKTPKKQS